MVRRNILSDILSKTFVRLDDFSKSCARKQRVFLEHGAQTTTRKRKSQVRETQYTDDVDGN